MLKLPKSTQRISAKRQKCRIAYKVIIAPYDWLLIFLDNIKVIIYNLLNN